MTEDIIQAIEDFLENGGEAQTTFTEAEMRARYGNEFMDDFWRQANDFIKSEAERNEEIDGRQ